MIFGRFFFVVFFSFVFHETLLLASEEISLGKKHIFILTSDNKEVFGTSYFAVFNTAKTAKSIRFNLFLPDNVSHFEPREGLLKEDFLLDDEGNLFVNKEFKPGLSLIGLDFKVAYSYSERGPLQFNLPFDLDEISLAVPVESGLALEAEGFKEGVPDMLSQGQYKGILKKKIKQGERLSIDVRGLPRSNFANYLVASACALGLFSILIFYFLSSLKFRKEFF